MSLSQRLLSLCIAINILCLVAILSASQFFASIWLPCLLGIPMTAALLYFAVQSQLRHHASAGRQRGRS
jgi:glucose/mannose transport system substrate-binding protein